MKYQILFSVVFTTSLESDRVTNMRKCTLKEIMALILFESAMLGILLMLWFQSGNTSVGALMPVFSGATDEGLRNHLEEVENRYNG